MNLNDIHDYLSGKKIVLLTVTKDTINFLKMYKELMVNFVITAIVDITLEYREEIRSILENVSQDIPIYTSISDLKQIEADLIIKFDHAIGDKRLIDEVETYNSSIFDCSSFEAKIKERYYKYINKESGNVFTFIMPLKYQSILNTYLLWNTNCDIIQCYGDSLLITYDIGVDLTREEQANIAKKRVIKFHYNALDFVDNDWEVNIYQLTRKEVRSLKPVFVLSSDFAGGKTSYILDKNDNYISSDLFSAFFDVGNYYGNGEVGIKSESLTTSIHNKLCRIRHFTPEIESIYIKIEGDLDSWMFPHIQGCGYRNSWADYHRYFDDYEFHLIIKDNENKENIIKKINLFCDVHHVDYEKIKIVTSFNHSKRFDITTLNKFLAGVKQ